MPLNVRINVSFDQYGDRVMLVNGELNSGLVVESMHGAPLDAFEAKMKKLGHPFDPAELGRETYRPIDVIVRAEGYYDHVPQSGPLSDEMYVVALRSMISLYWRHALGEPFYTGIIRFKDEQTSQRDPVLIRHHPQTLA